MHRPLLLLSLVFPLAALAGAPTWAHAATENAVIPVPLIVPYASVPDEELMGPTEEMIGEFLNSCAEETGEPELCEQLLDDCLSFGEPACWEL